MADTQLRNAVDELLVCAICQDEVNDPKSLLCQHTFCFLCLKAYVKSKDEKRKIMCPTCGQYTELSNGITQLPKNLFFSQLKDAAKYSKQSKSRTTSDGPTCSKPNCLNIVVIYCEKCEYLCKKCEKDHKAAPFAAKQLLSSSNNRYHLVASMQVNWWIYIVKTVRSKLALFAMLRSMLNMNLLGC